MNTLVIFDAEDPPPVRMRLVAAGRAATKDKGTLHVLALASRGWLPDCDACWNDVTSVFTAEEAVDLYVDASRIAALIDAAMTASAATTIMFSEYGRGPELAARLAYRHETTLIRQCDSISHADDGLLLTRSAYGGRVTETLSAVTPPAIMTVKDKAYGGAAVPEAPCPPVNELPLPPARDQRIGLLEARPAPATTGALLDEARIVISGGRGLGTAEGFDMLRSIADVAGAAVGSSRAAVDAGWMSHAAQVGQTGTTVAPDLYIAVGISGAVQHIAGMSNAKRVVAINTDEEASIFSVADVGIVGDYREVLPHVIDEIRQRRAG